MLSSPLYLSTTVWFIGSRSQLLSPILFFFIFVFQSVFSYLLLPLLFHGICLLILIFLYGLFPLFSTGIKIKANCNMELYDGKRDKYTNHYPIMFSSLFPLISFLLFTRALLFVDLCWLIFIFLMDCFLHFPFD